MNTGFIRCYHENVTALQKTDNLSVGIRTDDMYNGFGSRTFFDPVIVVMIPKDVWNFGIIWFFPRMKRGNKDVDNNREQRAKSSADQS